MIYEKDIEYARSRLIGTYVTLSKTDDPVYILDINRNGVVVYRQCGVDTGNKTCQLGDLSIVPLRLGFAESFAGSAYISRIPVRAWKQGARAQNLSVQYDPNDRVRSIDLDSDSLYRTHKGIFRSITDAADMIDCGEVCSSPFHRDFSLGAKTRGGFTLLWKGFRPAGIVAFREDVPMVELTDKFAYLQEAVDGAINV